MRAAVMRRRELVIDTVPDPVPQEGEVLVKTLACGICGSDLHMLKYAEQMAAASQEAGMPFLFDPRRDVVMGHEYCAEVVEYGPNTSGPVKRGDRVVAMGVILHNGTMQGVGYSNECPGGYGELMLLAAGMLLPVPDGLPTEHAAMTEPMAVGVHAVAKARLEAGDAPLVIGCGPVGLAVIASLKLRGAGPIVAADFSPKRRALAAHFGAEVVVDPAQERPFTAFQQAAGGRPAVVFECVGVPGLINQVMRDAPHSARIVVAGVCMEDDRIRPVFGINKELSIQFVLGYTPDEYASALHAIAEGRIDVGPMITGRVGIAGVPVAFETLAQPEQHAKIVVEPWRA